MRIRIRNNDLTNNITFKKGSNEYNYLLNVLKVKNNDEVFIFNNEFEYSYFVSLITKNEIKLEKHMLFKESEQVSDVVLLCPVMKGDKMTTILKQATELGIKTILPFTSDRTNVNTFNLERMQSNITEALEQSEGLHMPAIESEKNIKNILNNLNDYIILCGDTYALNTTPNFTLPSIKSSKIAVLIGPEGGLSKEEMDFISSRNNIIKMSLGNRIMRTETAAISLLTVAKILID